MFQNSGASLDVQVLNQIFFCFTEETLSAAEAFMGLCSLSDTGLRSDFACSDAEFQPHKCSSNSRLCHQHLKETYHHGNKQNKQYCISEKCISVDVSVSCDLCSSFF